MLSHIHIRNFQSLADVSLELKPLTVIVGPSSSGKSAFTRAVRTLTSNQRGESFISHGETQAVIKARTDRGTVALLRGKKNEYVIIPEDEPENQKVFTKLNGTTPEEVSEFIGIPARDPLNYSNQFDMPYLLTSSAAEVARTLGELTNVSVIFEASREANRRRLQASSTLKTRAQDYEDLTSNLERFRSLKEDQKIAAEAREVLKKAQALEAELAALKKIFEDIRSIPEPSPKKELPDLTELDEEAQSLATLRSLIEKMTAAEKAQRDSEENLKTAKKKKDELEEKYAQRLREEGTCPTCGQETSHVH